MIFAGIFCVIALVTSQVSADPDCPARDGKDPVYIPHEDCTKFWECSNGVPHLFNCSANLHFNPTLNVCDWPDQAGCKGGSGEDSDSSSSSSSSESGSKGDDDNSGDDKSDENNSDSGSNSGSSEGPECPAVDGKDPVYIPHEDCTKFWECSNGVPYLFNCSANLHFNPKLNVCDWPDQAGCEDGSGSDSSSSSSSSESGSKGDDDNSGGDSDDKDSGSSSSESCTSSSEEGPECPSVDGEDPVYIPHEDCTKFWQCSNGVPYLFNCSTNLHFNPTLNVCDWPDQAGCEGGSSGDSSSDSSSSSSSSESGSKGDDDNSEDNKSDDKDSSSSSSSSSSEEGPECPAVDGKDPVYIPHEDCTKFWQCSNGVPYLFNCSANLHFNPKLNVCDWPDQAGCEGGDNSSSSSSSSESNGGSNEDNNDKEESNGDSNEGDDDDDKSSGGCSNSSSSSSESDSCGGSSEEGPKCPAVDGKDAVYIPHEDCTKFWQCSNGTPYLFDCPANLHFNPKLNVCDWPDQAGCKGQK